MSGKDSVTKHSLNEYITTEMVKHKTSKSPLDVNLLKASSKILVKNYEIAQNSINKNYIKLKETTSQFRQIYHSIANKRNKNHYLETTFHDLVLKYKNKGYKMPDLSTKHNLFEPSPLLLQDNKIEEYYQLKEFERMESKRKIIQRQGYTRDQGRGRSKNGKNKINAKNNQEKKRDEKDKRKGYLFKLNKTVCFQKMQKRNRYFLSRPGDSYELLKMKNTLDNNNTNADDDCNYKKENLKLMKEIELLKDGIKEIKIVEKPSPCKSTKNNKPYNSLADDQMTHTFTTFNSTKYTSQATEGKFTKTISNQNLKLFNRLRSLPKKAEVLSNLTHSHSRNFQANLPISTSKIDSSYFNSQLDFAISKEEFLKQINNLNYDQLTLQQLEDIIKEYYHKYSDITNDKLKKYILRQKEPIALLQNIGRIQNNIRKYDVKGRYSLGNKREIKKLTQITALDAHALKLDKILGRNLIKVDNIE